MFHGCLALCLGSVLNSDIAVDLVVDTPMAPPPFFFNISSISGRKSPFFFDLSLVAAP